MNELSKRWGEWSATLLHYSASYWETPLERHLIEGRGTCVILRHHYFSGCSVQNIILINLLLYLVMPLDSQRTILLLFEPWQLLITIHPKLFPICVPVHLWSIVVGNLLFDLVICFVQHAKFVSQSLGVVATEIARRGVVIVGFLGLVEHVSLVLVATQVRLLRVVHIGEVHTGVRAQTPFLRTVGLMEHLSIATFDHEIVVGESESGRFEIALLILGTTDFRPSVVIQGAIIVMGVVLGPGWLLRR